MVEKVLITGASGFIGSNLCRYFLERSYKVYGLVRPTSNLHFLEALPVRMIRGDLEEAGSLQLPAELDYVIHAASAVSDLTPPEQAQRSIYDATVNLVGALEERGIRPRRFVYLSTSLVLGYRRRDISETNRGVSARFLPYTRAKEMAEEFLRARWQEDGLPLIILRPADVYGPNDRTSCLHILHGIEQGVPPIVSRGDSVCGFCYVDNLAQACLLACRMQGSNGQAYTVTNGTEVTWAEVFTIFLRRLGRRQRLHVPAAVAYIAAAGLQLLHALVPRFPAKLTFYRVRRITTDSTYDISATVRELGYRPDQDLERQANAIVDWYLAEKAAGNLPALLGARR